MTFDPPDKKYDLSSWQKKKACLYSQQIEDAAAKNKIDKHIYLALILVESGFNKNVVSSAGACGLTQVLPKYTGGIANKKKYTCRQLKNPRTSIAVGAKILRWWIDYHKNNSALTKKQKKKMNPDSLTRYYTARGLCGYNAGFRCKGSRPIKGGMRYANKVLKLSEYFKK